MSRVVAARTGLGETGPMRTETDVVVVGAGLAGLRCAEELRSRGHEVLVLERDDAVGGRIRTDRVDGFLLDRGFQLLNPAYPAARRWVDLDALGLQSFAAGVGARHDGGLAVLAHPLAEPRLLPATLRTAAARPREVLGVLRWLAPFLRARPGRPLARTLTARPDRTRREALDDARVQGLLRAVVDRFYSGVVLEDDGSTSQAFALLVAATFAAGTPGLPREGMQALPTQLAAPLGDLVRLGTAVRAVEPGADGVVVHTDGEAVHARQVVVAAGAPEAVGLAGAHGLDVAGVPPTHGVATCWFAAEEAPCDARVLVVDGRTRAAGPVVNTAVVSNVAPTYAPAGRHLVQASALVGPGRPDPVTGVVRRHAGELLGADPRGWTLLRRYDVVHALPAQAAPLVLRRPVRVGPRVVVCGDHRDTASIQGALVSGHRAALAVTGSRG